MNRRRFGRLALASTLVAAAKSPRGVAQEAMIPPPGLMPTARGNVARTGAQPGPGPTGEPVIRWRFATNALMRSSPAVAEGRVFAGSDDGFLFGIDAIGGTAHWGIDLGNRIRTTPAIHHEYVFVANGALNVVGVRTGNTVNRVTNDRFQLTASLAPAETSAGAAIFGSGINGASGFVDARDPVTGRPHWRRDVVNHTVTSPTIAAETVVIGTLGGEVGALAAANGDWLWRRNVSGGVYSAPAVANGVVYAHAWALGRDVLGNQVPNASGMLHAIDLATGEERWRVETASPVESGPAVLDDVVIVGGGSTIFAFGVLDGGLLWRVETRGDVRSSPVLADGVVYIGSDDGLLYAIEGASGALHWSIDIGAPVESTAAVVAGTVYITAADSLLAIGGQ